MLIDLCEEIVRIYASNTDLIFLEYLFLSYKKNLKPNFTPKSLFFNV